MFYVLYQTGHDWADDGVSIMWGKEFWLKVFPQVKTHDAAKYAAMNRVLDRSWEDEHLVVRVVAVVAC